MKKWILILSLLLLGCSQTPTSQPAADQPRAQIEVTVVVPARSSEPALPAGPISLVALGDSLTLGEGDEAGFGYPGRLLAFVNEFRPGSTMTNLGQSGWTSDALINGDQGIESQLDRATLELESAASEGRGAVAFVWIGSNDLWYLYEFGEGSDENDLADINHFLSNITTILARLRETGAVVVVALLDDQSKRPVARRGEAFTGISGEELSRMSVQVDQYNGIIAVKAAQYGAILVDFYSTEIFTNSATLDDDGIHPNQVGYGLITERWLDALAPFLLQ